MGEVMLEAAAPLLDEIPNIAHILSGTQKCMQSKFVLYMLM